MSFFRLTLSFITGVYVGQTYPTVINKLKAFPSLKDDIKKKLDKIGEK